MHEIAELDRQGLRKFGLIMGAIVVGLFGLALPWLLDHDWPLWPWVVAAAFWLPALVYPAILKPVYRGWMKFGLLMGFINTRLILGLFYYVILAPIGLIMRLFGHDPMRRAFGTQDDYRVPSKPRPHESMEKPY